MRACPRKDRATLFLGLASMILERSALTPVKFFASSFFFAASRATSVCARVKIGSKRKIIINRFIQGSSS